MQNNRCDRVSIAYRASIVYVIGTIPNPVKKETQLATRLKTRYDSNVEEYKTAS